jgi:hypothetical protein
MSGHQENPLVIFLKTLPTVGFDFVAMLEDRLAGLNKKKWNVCLEIDGREKRRLSLS